MKKLFFVFVLVLPAFYAGAQVVGEASADSLRSEETAIREMCLHIAGRYPAADLQDVYKSCYQDFFGAEHLMRDTAAARRYLETELAECDTVGFVMPDREPTGFRHRYTRVSLACIRKGEITKEQLLEQFVAAASRPEPPAANWAQEWMRIERIALQVNPGWRNPALQSQLRHAARQERAVRHSDAFRSAYHPHYRIVRSEEPVR